MRPLVLKIRGLRSYRNDVEIDFHDRNLVAIIGDTGAGKSSILEALCFALYGTATWSGKAVTDLISSGATAVSVELRFRADGRAWTVNRTARVGTAPSLHKLMADDDPSVHFDSATAVNAKIKELVGLDYDGFLRAVVLPQGRFQQLLQSAPGPRTGVLKAIFRVDELEAVRSTAQNARIRVADALANVRIERARYLDDPAAVAEESRTAADKARTRLEVLDAAALEISAASASADNQRNRAARLQVHAEAISRARRRNDAQQLEVFSALEMELSRLLKEASERAEVHEIAARSIAAELNAADELGVGAAGISSAIATLESAIVALPEINHEDAELERERAALVDLAGQIAADEESLRGLKQKAIDDRGAAEVASDMATKSKEALDVARTSLENARRLVGDRGTALGEHNAAVDQYESLKQQLAAAQDAQRAATDLLASAEAKLEEIQRQDHAAAAAEGRGPGDPCPVCARELPLGFAPPHAQGEADARRDRDEASREEQRALGVSKRLEGLVDAAELATANSAKKLDETEANAKTALDELAGRLPWAKLADDDASCLAPLAALAADAADAATRANTVAQSAELTVNTTATALNGSRKELARRTTELDGRSARLVTRRKQQADAIAALPADLRPGAAESISELRDAQANARNRLEAIRDRERERDRENDEVRSTRVERDALISRIDIEVRPPVAAVAEGQAALEQCLATVALDLDLPAPESDGPDETLTAGMAAARDVRACELLATCAHGSEEATRKALESNQRIAAALARVACADAMALQQETVTVAADLKLAATQMDEALRQKPIAIALDSRISDAGGLVAALEAVYSHLSDAKFIEYVLRRRQLVLLAVASEIFASMSNARYGFAENFEIVDRWSGQPRDVMTLSGGETFLASLSLALALVELAGRGGGRLEALFLDEGFGSLDANTLPEALKTLESQASGGRLVAVISHLRAVAETIDDVLHVVRGPDGSKASWLTAQERDALLSSDAESGLLT